MMIAKPAPKASSETGATKFPDSSAWDQTGFLLWHAMLEYRRKVNHVLADLGLTHAQFSLLASAAYLNHRGGAPSQAELAEHTGMDVMMTSQVVRLLERAHLVNRITDENDARLKRIVPTPKGEMKAIEAVTLVERLNEEVFGLIEEADRFKEALRLVADRDAEGHRVSAK